MALNIHQQIAENIKSAQKILITFTKNSTGDHISSALALSLALQKLNKEITIISENFSLSEKYKFLPQSNTIQNTLDNPKKLQIQLDVSKIKVNDFSYEVVDDRLNIYITPENGVYNKEDVKVMDSKGKYDLIFTLGTPDLDSLGKIYVNNREFFFEAPVINIDHNSNNENYGQINLVELTATSIAEALYTLLDALNKKLIDADVGTCLLCGIISATKSFRSKNVTPRALQIAATLIENQAKREEIVKNLYYNRAISTLQMWGNLLTRLKTDINNQIIWVTTTEKDFTKFQDKPENIIDIFDELIANLPEAKISSLIYEKGNSAIGVYIHSFDEKNLLELFKDSQPRGTHEFISFSLENISLTDAEEKITKQIKEIYHS